MIIDYMWARDYSFQQKKEELRVKAAQELADWWGFFSCSLIVMSWWCFIYCYNIQPTSNRYKQYEEQLAKTRKANKEQEAATVVPEVSWKLLKRFHKQPTTKHIQLFNHHTNSDQLVENETSVNGASRWTGLSLVKNGSGSANTATSVQRF